MGLALDELLAVTLAPPESSSTRGALSHWLANRDARFLASRSASLLRRYGLASGRGRRRIVRSVHDLNEHGCLPTYPTPGRTVERHPDFFRQLASMGVELAVHSYDHVDFRGISTEAALGQLEKAAGLFDRLGIPFEGFRCPYLGYTEEMLAAVPPGLFRYSSNRSVLWSGRSAHASPAAGSLYESLTRFYRGAPSSLAVALPRDCGNLIEIPLSVPDDLQLYDGLGLGADGVREAWCESFEQTYERGELFAPLCHPEAYDRCADAFHAILDRAATRRPGVWITQLRDIAGWWSERATVRPEIESAREGLRVRFGGSPRATVLVRDLPATHPTTDWSGRYRVLESRGLELSPGTPRPFVGAAADVPDATVAFLREAGYVVERGERASECALLLDDHTVDALAGDHPLVEWIEASRGPLVKVAAWPDRAQSAFAIAGDLDALSLLDYAARVIRLSVGDRLPARREASRST